MNFTGERYIPQLSKNRDEIEIEHMQRYLALEKVVKGKVVLDAACGEGYGSNIIANHAKMVYSIDISEEAIVEAREKYKKNNIQFMINGIEKIDIPDNSIDIVVSFETIEHVNEEIQNKFLLEVKRILKDDGLLIISTPDKKNYSDLLDYHNEFHVKEFYKEEFLTFLKKYFTNIQLYNQGYEVASIISSINSKKLTVFDDSVDIESKYLIAICSNARTNNTALLEDNLIIKSKGEYFNNIKRIINLQNKIEELSSWGEKINIEKDIYIERLGYKDKEISTYKEEISTYKEEISTYKEEISTYKEEISAYKEEIEKYKNDLDNLKAIYFEDLNSIESEKQNIYEMYQSVFKTATQYQETLQSIYNSNMWKVASRYYRFRGKIDKYFKFLNKKKKQEVKNKTNIENDNIDTDVMEDSNLIDFDTSAYNYRSNQDIIILSVIDWDFRYQRPQHIADNFRKLNHRVFYFNANYTEKKLSIKEQKDNLYSVNLSCDYGERIYDIDFTLDESKYKEQISNLLKQFNINEATVIVEYPTWAPVAKHLKENWKFNIVFDYIDDYSGFEDTVSLKLHSFTEQLFKISDFVIATSNFLEARALEYSKNVEVIRNGTEFDFFNKAINKESKNSNKKIGYYGAIAEWFDLEKIQYIAKNRPEYEIELIGNVTNKSCSALKKYKNIKFLGEKPYSELPKYLMDYDVCLIPFKSDIDLIKATNPVKFYEYLSAGKKIVATEIPELEPYRDKFVYLTNSNEKFLKYVDMCLDGKDSLYKPSELVGFAIKQDWSIRVKDIEKAIKKYTPLVSIIVVTYNNLKYTKMCIDSIIGKTAYPNYEIVIVDNCSKDDTRGYLKNLEKMHDNIKIILNDENLGFAAGNNVGIKSSKGEYIILLNNDTVVTNGWMTSLIKHLDNTKIGMICPVTNSIGNEAQINVDYSKIEDMDSFALNYTTKHQGELYYDINVLAMFCVALKRTIIDEVGYLDENYAVGMFEDDDYSLALKNKGYIVACAEDVFIHHFGSVSFKKLDDANYRRIFEKNKKYFEEKWNTLWIPHKYRDDVKPN